MRTLNNLREQVKLNFFKLYEEGKMSKELAERMVSKMEHAEKMELESWLKDTEQELRN